MYYNYKPRRMKVYNIWRVKNYRREWVRAILFNHKKKGHKINILVDSLELIAKHSKNCPLCGIELDWSPLKGYKKNNSPSLDRINNEDFLDIHNIVIICSRCNTTKYDRTLEKFVEYCRMIVKLFDNFSIDQFIIENSQKNDLIIKSAGEKKKNGSLDGYTA